MKEIRTEIIIDSSKEVIWDILTSFSDYPGFRPEGMSFNGSILRGKPNGDPPGRPDGRYF